MAKKIDYLNFFVAYIKLFLGWGTVAFLLVTLACANSRLGGKWTVPSAQIAEGEGNGDIPAINNPQFTKASQTTYLTDESTIIGIKIGENIKAYPLEILDWHEVVNEEIDSIPIAITYSTLSGSSIAFDRNINGTTVDFRITGLLYNSNTILSEFETFTDWSQMLRRGIRGDLSEVTLKDFQVLEMNWAKWKQLFPNSAVLNQNTSYNRPYGTYPYGDYRIDSTNIFFNLPHDLDSLNQVLFLKEKILGVKVADVVKGYKLDSFQEEGFSIIEDEINGEPIIIIGSPSAAFMVAYSAKNEDGQRRALEVQEQDGVVLIVDQADNKWSIFGINIENNQLPLGKLESNIAYWFSWATFYPQIEIFQG